jgi:hypothetical protein
MCAPTKESLEGRWPGDGTKYRVQVDAPATVGALAASLDELKKVLKQGDRLLLYTSGHGVIEDEVPMLLTHPSSTDAAGGAKLSAKDLAFRLNGLGKLDSLVVVMGQCHSGGFVDPILALSQARRTTVAAAVTEGMASTGFARFNFFERDWISGFRGARPTGEPPRTGDGIPAVKGGSVMDAFAYANAIHDPDDRPVLAMSGEERHDSQIF